MDSILTSIKKLLGIAEEYEHFDPDIIMHINTAILNLTQLGIGPPEGFMIEDKETVWTDFVPDATFDRMQAVKSYIYFKVRLMFDPPTMTSVIDATERMIAELEWRLNVAAES